MGARCVERNHDQRDACVAVHAGGADARVGGPLLGGLFVMLGCGILGLFYPHPVLHSVMLYGGLALFTAFTAYDTQMILNDYKEGQRDVVQHSIGLFINFMA